MSFFNSMDIATSGLTAQRTRLDIIAQNLTNMNTTRTAEGGPYKKKMVSFETILKETQEGVKVQGVQVSEIVEDEGPGVLVYDPSHPDANEEGYVEKPNINAVEEMTNMISASRAYEANVTAFNTMKSMALKALEIGR